MTDSSSNEASPERYARYERSGIARWLIAAIVVAVVVVILAVVMLPDTGGRRPSKRTMSISNLNQLSKAVLSYSARKTQFPPAYVAADDGKPMTSWRALLLHDAGRGDLMEMYDFAQPWDSPHNRKVAEIEYELFRSPLQKTRKKADGLALTNYVAVVGDETMFPGGEGTPMTVQGVPDGFSYTLLLVEILDSDIAWAEPRDLTVDEFLERVRQGKNFRGPNRLNDPCIVAFADGSVKAIPLDVLNETNARALLTRAAGDEIKLDFR